MSITPRVTYFFVALVTSCCVSSQAALVSEFSSNPPGTDPATQTIELSGTPGATVSGFLSSIDTDGGPANFIGTIDRQTDLTPLNGVYDTNGLFTVDVPDLENPSFALVYSSLNGGGLNANVDTDGNGLIDDPSVFGTVFDAVSVADVAADAMVMYGSQLGGIDLAFSGAEPEIVFRSGSTGDWFVVNTIGDSNTIFDAAANNVMASQFDTDPSVGTTFGAINPAAVPEPGSLLFAAYFGTSMLLRRRRKS